MTHTLRGSRMTHTLFKQADTCRCNNVATHALPASFLRFFVFLRSAAPWARLGQFGAAWAVSHAPQVALPYALADTYPPHARHMSDTCSTHVWQAGAVLEMHDGVENGYDCDSLQDKDATRIKAQHGQSKPEDNYSCHNQKTMQYSCHNPKR